MRIIIAIALIVGSTAQAYKIRPYEPTKAKSMDAIYTLGKPTEVNVGEALGKALEGQAVYKCTMVEAAATKSGLSLKNKKLELGK